LPAIACGSARSNAKPIASPPKWRAAASARAAWRLVNTILSPRAAKAAATAKPMPLDPPTMTLVFRSLISRPFVARRSRRRDLAPSSGEPRLWRFALRRRFG